MRSIGLILLLFAGLKAQANFSGNLSVTGNDYSTLKVKKTTHHQRGVLKIRIKELEKIAGRKFTWKEKIEIRVLAFVYKKKLHTKRIMAGDPDKQGRWAFLFALAALPLLSLALFNLIGIIVGLAIPVLALLALWLGLKSAREGKNFKNMFAILVGGAITLLEVIIIVMALSF